MTLTKFPSQGSAINNHGQQHTITRNTRSSNSRNNHSSIGNSLLPNNRNEEKE